MVYYKYLLPVGLIADVQALAFYAAPYEIEPGEPPIFSSTHKIVDAIWASDADEPEAWTEHRVKPTEHRHWFDGQQELWHACNP